MPPSSRTQGQPIEEQRNAKRFALVMPARCKSRSGFTDRVVVTDLSATGCRIESKGLTVRVGWMVILKTPGIEALYGKVCWVGGHVAGIAFDRALYLPVVEHLHRSHAQFLAEIMPATGRPARRVI